MKETDKAYLAGYFDADGCITAWLGDGGCNNIHIQAVIAGRNVDLLQELELVYGGSLSQHDSNSGKRHIWRWAMRGRKAIPFLKDILPHLRLKKRQVELAIGIAQTMRIRGKEIGLILSSDIYLHRARLALEICQLNQANLSNPRITKTITYLKDFIREKNG